MAGKTPEEIIALADSKMAELPSGGYLDPDNPDPARIAELLAFGGGKGALLTADAALLYAAVYPLVEDPAQRTKLRRAITACHGVFTVAPLALSKMSSESIEGSKKAIVTGVSLAALAGITYLNVRDAREPEPEEFADETVEKSLQKLIIAMPVILVSVDAATTAAGGYGTMEANGFSATDYVVGTTVSLATILGLLKLQDMAMTKIANRRTESELTGEKPETDQEASRESEKPDEEEVGLVKRTAAKIFALDPADGEFNQELMMKAVTVLISSYAFRGLLDEGLGIKSSHELAGFTPQSVGTALAFTIALSQLSAGIERRRERRRGGDEPVESE